MIYVFEKFHFLFLNNHNYQRQNPICFE